MPEETVTIVLDKYVYDAIMNKIAVVEAIYVNKSADNFDYFDAVTIAHMRYLQEKLVPTD